ncbi:MAG: succinate dehydrogenase, cytochrome b556 subunit [Gallionellaceae bacterium]|nr:succinate dehydrogenase, cytochrome b556 subunit [Gallionellaceae bacterium]
MKPKRPYFLDLAAIRLPIGGMVSILHRASGAALSLALPCLLYTLMLSLRAPEDFQRVAGWFSGFLGWIISMGLIWALLHHFLAGLRHLGFDLGCGEDKEVARKSAWFSLLAAAGLTALIALWRLT